MKRNTKIIGENYPEIGDIFYWKDEDGDVHEDTCLKIEEKDNPDLETMYFTYITPNGGGTFVTEDCIINPLSMDILIYKKKKYQAKAKEIADMFNDDVFRQMIYSPFRKVYGEDGASDMLDKIVNILGNIENYEYHE